MTYNQNKTHNINIHLGGIQSTPAKTEILSDILVVYYDSTVIIAILSFYKFAVS